jgi:hypothetical protein
MGSFGNTAINRPIVPARSHYDDGETGGMIICTGIEALGENLSQCLFVHHKPHMLCPDANPGRRGGKPATTLLSYGTSLMQDLNIKIGITQSSYKGGNRIELARDVVYMRVCVNQ